MKVVQINITSGSGSTGKICVDISKKLTSKNIENYILYSSGTSDYPFSIKYSGAKYTKFQALKSRITGRYGFTANNATLQLIDSLERIKPDIVHLHNMHGHNCNLETLLEYLKNSNVKVFWTFHDCWVFTGYCTHFMMAGCYKWQNECENCPQRRKYSWFFDKSNTLFNKKKQLLQGLDLTIITPSKWIAEMAEKSFLKERKVIVINNGIDLTTFKPRKSNFRETYNIPEEKVMVLGVSFGWNNSKGLDVFCELANKLDNDKFQIVLVGTDSSIDRKLNSNIISIRRTENPKQLAEIYTTADMFINPTREEVLGMVNIEALACGTPVITFNTGGSPEVINERSGLVVKSNDVQGMIESIHQVIHNNISENDCINRAKYFDRNEKFDQYLDLYLECQ